MVNTEQDFIRVMQDAGMEPPITLTPGKIHRFPGAGKTKGNTSGWCVLFEDRQGGVFGDWASELKQSWHIQGQKSLTKSECEKFRQKVEEAKQLARQEKLQSQSQAAERALLLWNNAPPATTSHPYLLKKHVKPYAARMDNERLVLPVTDCDGAISTLHFIDNDGQKRFLKDGRKQGRYIYINGPLEHPARIIICEGWATGATIAVHYDEALVLSAIDTGNLLPVAILAKQQWPAALLIIAGDDDRKTTGNPGATKARAVASEVGAALALPQWSDDVPRDLSDFNDLYVWRLKNKLDINAPLMGKIEKIDQMESWPTLVRLDHPNLPKFDLSWLPNWAGDFAEALATHTETPTTLAGCLVLAACSTAAARRIEVMPFEGHTEPCNLWIVVALPPGSRKSSVHRAAVAPLVEWEKDQAFINEPEIKRLTSQRECSEARIKALRRKAANTKKIADSEEYANEAIDIEDNLPEIPVNPRLWTSDSTPEKLGNLLAENNGCLGWLSSEGGLFDMLNGRYSRGVPNLDLFLKAHSGDPERVDRGSREHVYIESARLSIGLSPQPDVLRGLANNPGFKGRGLLARFLYFMPVSTVGYRTLTPTPIPKAVQDKYDAGLRAMLDYSESTHYQLSLSQEAYAEWLAFSLTIERDMRAGGDLAEHTDWGGKAPGAAARVSGVLHAIKYAHTAPERHTIDQTTMMHAIAIIDIAKQHTLYALDLMSAEDDIDDARQAWLWISINALTEPITERDIFQGMRARFARMNKLQETLSILEERGYIKRSSSQSNKAGRPSSPIIQIRPNLCKENKNELE